jgi:hypothetical protein
MDGAAMAADAAAEEQETGEEIAARVLDGRAWRDFCDALAGAGQLVLGAPWPPDPLDRAEGYRYLSRLARVALETFVEFADPLYPAFRRPAHETAKMGADNPDNVYLSAAVSGEHDYRIAGTRGTIHYLGIGSYAGAYGASGRRGQDGYVEAKDLAIGPDGRFELRVSATRQPGNWLPMRPDSGLLIVRQSYRDRAREVPAELAIERIGAEGPPPPLSPELLGRGLAQAAAWVQGTASLFRDWAESFSKCPNQLPLFDPAVAAAAHGDPNIVYYHGWWELEPDEALLVEVTPPACDYWNFQVNNVWMESLDYRFHRIALNHCEAELASDGSLRLVLAHEDPGVPNWLETAGHRRGTMCLRWVGAREHPAPRTRVVKRSELAG